VTPGEISAVAPPRQSTSLSLVEPRNITPAESTALVALLDDPSPAVRQSLLAHFTQRGEAARALLQDLARGADRELAAHAAWYLRELKFSDPVAEFRGFIQSLNYELETGLILLTRTVNPAFDVTAFSAQLDAFAARVRKLLPKAATMRGQCRVINRVLFEEYGLRGNSDHYADPRNSFPDQVLERRLGIPISLSVIYLLVAQRIGLDLEPVGVPGHFLVGGYEPEGPFFVDAFNRGLLLAPEDVFERIRALNHTPQLADLAPTPVREVLCRMCRNLVNHFTVADDPANAKLFAEFVAEFEATHERHASP
jgi:regulator of sirC expression with transglutaminase-like and TPR domain